MPTAEPLVTQPGARTDPAAAAVTPNPELDDWFWKDSEGSAWRRMEGDPVYARRPPSIRIVGGAARGGAGAGMRARRCGACEACLLPDCGLCANCLDKPRFGGPGTAKQACKHRKCLQPILPAAALCLLPPDTAVPVIAEGVAANEAPVQPAPMLALTHAGALDGAPTDQAGGSNGGDASADFESVQYDWQDLNSDDDDDMCLQPAVLSAVTGAVTQPVTSQPAANQPAATQLAATQPAAAVTAASPASSSLLLPATMLHAVSSSPAASIALSAKAAGKRAMGSGASPAKLVKAAKAATVESAAENPTTHEDVQEEDKAVKVEHVGASVCSQGRMSSRPCYTISPHVAEPALPPTQAATAAKAAAAEAEAMVEATAAKEVTEEVVKTEMDGDRPLMDEISAEMDESDESDVELFVQTDSEEEMEADCCGTKFQPSGGSHFWLRRVAD